MCRDDPDVDSHIYGTCARMILMWGHTYKQNMCQDDPDVGAHIRNMSQYDPDVEMHIYTEHVPG
jgi:hypothetical protein